MSILIGSYVPQDDPKWQNFLLLLDIIDILFSRRITEDIPGVLHELIKEYLTNFTLLYPNEVVTPKMHYIIHGPMTNERSKSTQFEGDR